MLHKFVVGFVVFWRKSWWSIRQRLWPGRPVTINYLFWPSFRLYPHGQVAYLAFAAFFERRHLRFALPYIHPGMITVDVGANIGLWSICLAQRVGRTGQVHAFEPNRNRMPS